VRLTGPDVVSIVMPVSKEGEAVEPVLRAMTAAVSATHEILVVYDFDEDPTVWSSSASRPNCRRSVVCEMTSEGESSTP